MLRLSSLPLNIYTLKFQIFNRLFFKIIKKIYYHASWESKFRIKFFHKKLSDSDNTKIYEINFILIMFLLIFINLNWCKYLFKINWRIERIYVLYFYQINIINLKKYSNAISHYRRVHGYRIDREKKVIKKKKVIWNPISEMSLLRHVKMRYECKCMCVYVCTRALDSSVFVHCFPFQLLCQLYVGSIIVLYIGTWLYANFLLVLNTWFTKRIFIIIPFFFFLV